MLEIKNIGKIYRFKKTKVQALSGVNLQFERHGFIVITGKSGSGKSTLLNLIGGLDQFDKGEIILNHQSTKDFNQSSWDNYRNTYVGFVFQEFYLIEEYTVGKNIALALELQGYSKEEIKDKVKDILKQVDLINLMNRKPSELSGGQKQRIAIARALIKNPEIILCDEPTGNLDSQTGELILSTLKKLSKEKLIIMVTHDKEFANKYGDRIIELKDGVVIKDTENKNEQSKIYSLTNKTVIELPKGKKLDEDVIHYLDKKLEFDDLYLSISNQNYVKDDIDKPKETKELKNIKRQSMIEDRNNLLKIPSFSFKNGLVLAFSSIFHKKFRLFLMLFLFIASLIFVGVFLTFSFYNPKQAMVETFEQANLKMIPFTKQQEVFCFEETCFKNIDVDISDDEIIHLTNEFQGINFYKSMKTYLKIPNAQRYTMNYFYQDAFTRISIIENNTHLNIIGEYPQNNDEIMITDYMAFMMRHYHFVKGTSNQNVIGKSLYDFTISGIIETNFKKYESQSIDFENYYHSQFIIDYNEVYGQILMTKETYDSYLNNHLSNIEFSFDKNHGQNITMVSTHHVNQASLVGNLPTKSDEIVVSESYLENVILEDLELTDLDKENYTTILGNYYPFHHNVVIEERYNGANHIVIDKEYKIVGVKKEETDYDIIFYDTEYQFLNQHNNISYGVAVLGNDSKTNASFIYLLDWEQYRSKTAYSDDLHRLPFTINRLKSLLTIISGIFIGFAVGMIFFFISSSINSRQKDIGTLRALGAKGKDIGMIFLYEALMIVLVAAIISNSLLFCIIKFINSYITKGIKIQSNFLTIHTNGFDLEIVVLYMNFYVILYTILLAIIIVLFSTYIPIRRITLMKPINAIKKAF